MAFTVNKKAFCVLEFAKTESIVTVQRRFRIMYHTEPPTDKTVREWYMNSSRVAACALRNEQAVRAHRPIGRVRKSRRDLWITLYSLTIHASSVICHYLISGHCHQAYSVQYYYTILIHGIQLRFHAIIFYMCITYFIVMFMYSYCYVCSVLYILFSSCQLARFGNPNWGFSVLFPQL